MAWEVEYTNEFEAWWETLAEAEQETIDAAIEALEEHGPALGRPLVENIHQSRHPNLKELRVPGTNSNPLRFRPKTDRDPPGRRRQARLMEHVVRPHVPIADQLYDDHLNEIKGTTERRE